MILLIIVLAIILILVVLIAYQKIKTQLQKSVTELEEANKNLLLIHELSLEISTILELEKLLPKIVDAFAQAGKVKKCSLMLLNEETADLEIKAGIGLSERAIQCVRPKLGEGVAGTVANTGKPILISDTAQDKMLYKDYVSDSTKPRPKETLLALPLVFRGRVLGVINLDAKISGQPFIHNDEVLLSTLANQSAAAITNAQLYELAITDGLTKLFIHRYFQMRIAQEMERAKRYNLPLSLLLLDIDRFKTFNDNYGHQVGDLALVHLSKILRESLRITDICARYGGEEFVIILPETENADAVYVAERIRKKVETLSFTAVGQELKITISMGVTTYHGEKKVSRLEFIRQADKALYSAKEHGRNMVYNHRDLA